MLQQLLRSLPVALRRCPLRDLPPSIIIKSLRCIIRPVETGAVLAALDVVDLISFGLVRNEAEVDTSGGDVTNKMVF